MEKKEKPLEKMTAKELREVALEIPEIEGVHAMKKEDLLAAIRKAREIEEEVKQEKAEEVEQEEKEEMKQEKAEEVEQEKKEEVKQEKKKEVKKEKKKAEGPAADLKKRIREFKALKEEAVKKRDVRMAEIYKRRINRLKKRTRKAA